MLSPVFLSKPSLIHVRPAAFVTHVTVKQCPAVWAFAVFLSHFFISIVLAVPAFPFVSLPVYDAFAIFTYEISVAYIVSSAVGAFVFRFTLFEPVATETAFNHPNHYSSVSKSRKSWLSVRSNPHFSHTVFELSFKCPHSLHTIKFHTPINSIFLIGFTDIFVLTVFAVITGT